MQNISQRGNFGSPRTLQTPSISGLIRSQTAPILPIYSHPAAPSGRPARPNAAVAQGPPTPLGTGSPHTHPGSTTWPGCAHSSRTTPARSDLSLRSARADFTQPPEVVRAGAVPAGSAEAAASHTASTEPMRTAAPAATFHSSRRSGVGPGQRTSAPAAAAAPSVGTPAAGGASIATQRAARTVATTEARKENTGAQGAAPTAGGGDAAVPAPTPASPAAARCALTSGRRAASRGRGRRRAAA